MKNQINLNDISPELREQVENELKEHKGNEDEKIKLLVDKYGFDNWYAESFLDEQWGDRDITIIDKDIKKLKENIIFYKTDDGESDFNEFDSEEKLKDLLIKQYQNPDSSSWEIYKIFVDGKEVEHEVTVEINFKNTLKTMKNKIKNEQ